MLGGDEQVHAAIIAMHILPLVLGLTIGDKVFYTKLTELSIPMKVVGHSDEGYVGLEYHQDGLRVVNHRCPMDSISFGIPGLDSAAPSPEVPPNFLGDEGDGSPLRRWGGCSLKVAHNARAVRG